MKEKEIKNETNKLSQSISGCFLKPVMDFLSLAQNIMQHLSRVWRNRSTRLFPFFFLPHMLFVIVLFSCLDVLLVVQVVVASLFHHALQVLDLLVALF